MNGETKPTEKTYKIRSMETDLQSQKKGVPPPANVPLELGQKKPGPQKLPTSPGVAKPPLEGAGPKVLASPGTSRGELTPPVAEEGKLSPFSKPIQKPYSPTEEPKLPKLKPLPIPSRPSDLGEFIKEGGKPAVSSRIPASPETSRGGPIPPSDKIPFRELPKIKPPAGGRDRRAKKIIILSIVAGVILLFIIGEIWWFFIRPAGEETVVTTSTLPAPEEILPPEQVKEEAVIEKMAIPTALINYGSSQTLSLTTVSPQEFSTGIDTIKAKVGKNTFLRVVPTLKENGAERVLTMSEIISALKITISPAVADSLSGESDIFLFGGVAVDQTTCQQAGISNIDCYGPRLGLVLKTKSDPSLSLSSWEQTMASDLKSLILTQVSIGPGKFLDATYKGTLIRYQNFPINTMTIDYALSGDLLFITTSKSSIYKAIDSLGN